MVQWEIATERENEMNLAELVNAPGVLPQDPGRNKVLVVDDDLNHRMLMVRLLRKHGYECQPASSTQEAREQLRAAAFGLVVTDMRMFAEDGIELVRHVADRYPTTCSVVVTGLEVDELEGQLHRAGAFSVVAKPIERESFSARIDEAMDHRDQTVELRRHQSA